MIKTAEISPCGRYRYLLTRSWDESSGQCVFIMLNPSTADGWQDDPTIRRCIGFARAWGYGTLQVVNLFAWRATDPREIGNCYEAGGDPVGPESDKYISLTVARAEFTVCAWGAQGIERGQEVRRILSAAKLHHLGLTQRGMPKHPLYLRKDTKPIEWKR